MKHLNYGQGENASLSAIGPEKQEQEISHKRSGNSVVRPLISIFKCLHPWAKRYISIEFEPMTQL